MDPIEWDAPARLHERDADGRSAPVRVGSLRELAHHVALLSAEHRAGLAIESGGRTFDIGAILELAAREDLGD